MTESSRAQVDVDELAREKVQEVERLLDSSNGFKQADLTSWFSILQQIITAADLHRTNDKNDSSSNLKSKIETGESIYADYADDGEQFNTVDLSEQFASNSVKWTIRVQAFKLVHRLVILSKSPILKYLPDLVRLSFVAATSPYDDLKIQGFEMFKVLINRFASVEEKEFPGHSILEQYRTQVLSALKPAFNLDSPPYITAIASHVCCLWVCRGMEKDPNNLSRTCQMMMATIEKLENQSVNQNSKLYTESELEQERLDILCSWAELYIAARESDINCPVDLSKLFSPPKVDSKQLNEIIKPQIGLFIDKWWEALKDYALLIIPAPALIGSSSHDNEHVYTREVALRLFAPVWPRLILASTIWLCLDDAKPFNKSSDNLSNPCEVLDSPNDNDKNICDNSSRTDKTKYFKFICGLLMKELCRCYSDDDLQQESLPEATIFAIRCLFFIVNDAEMKLTLVEDLTVSQELYAILYGILIRCSRGRSNQHLVLKSLLDQIFSLVTAKLVENIECAKYSLAKLLESTECGLRNLESFQDKQDFETIKLNLYIKIHHAITVIKLTSKLCMTQVDLFNALIDIFQGIIKFEADPSLGISLVGTLKELYSMLPEELVVNFMSAMFDSQTKVVTSLLKLIQTEDSIEKNDKKAQFLTIAEIHIKSIISALDLANADSRSKLIKVYLNSSLNALPKILSSDNMKDFPLGKRNALDIGLSYIEGIRSRYPDDFKVSLGTDSDVYEAAVKLQQDIKAADESKRDSQAVKKPQANYVGVRKPPPAKIVLKADFSNFYAKKP